jgi:hypothetical protein
VAPTVNSVTTGTMVTTANPTVTLAATPAAGDVLILLSVNGTTTDAQPSAISGAGATWTRIAGAHNYMNFWMGVNPTSSGTITATAPLSTAGRQLRLYHLSGVQGWARLQPYLGTGLAQRVSEGQIMIGAAFSQSAGTNPIAALTPQYGWTIGTQQQMVGTNRLFNTTHIIPSMALDAVVQGNAYALTVVVGSPIPGTTVVRENLVWGSSSETVTTQWSRTSGGALSVDSAVGSVSGTKALKTTANAAAVEVYQSFGSYYTPVVAGKTYTISGYVYMATNSRSAAATVRWMTKSASVFQIDVGTPIAVTPNTWTRVSITSTAPATTDFCAVGARFTDGVTGDVTYWDAFMIEEGSTATAYWDGYSGPNYAFMGPSDSYQSIETTAAPAPAAVVHAVTAGALTTTANPTVTLADTPAAGDVLVLVHSLGTSTDAWPTAVSGCGATWTRIPGASTTYQMAWIGVGATSSGTVTTTATSSTNGRVNRLFHLKNVTADVFTQAYDILYGLRASPSQAVIGMGYSSASLTSAITARMPATGWTDQTEIVHTSTSRRSNTSYIVPTAAMGYGISGSAAANGVAIVVGSPVAGMSVVARNRTYGPSVDYSMLGYSSTAATLTISATPTPPFGVGALRVAMSGANAEVWRASSQPLAAVVPGETYTASVYVYTPSTKNVTLNLKWYLQPSAGILSTTTSSVNSVPGTTWTRLTYTATAPAGVMHAAIGVNFPDSVSGEVYYTDSWMLNDGATALPYFDGLTTTPGYTNLYMGQHSSNEAVQLVVSGTTIHFKDHNGTTWTARTATPKAWNGSAWVVRRPKRWSGSGWVDLP